MGSTTAKESYMATGKETKSGAPAQNLVRPMAVPKDVDPSVRAGKPGLPYTGAPGHNVSKPS